MITPSKGPGHGELYGSPVIPIHLADIGGKIGQSSTPRQHQRLPTPYLEDAIFIKIESTDQGKPILTRNMALPFSKSQDQIAAGKAGRGTANKSVDPLA
jgi:hypothetical protein